MAKQDHREWIARCAFPGCPIRFRTGLDRWCPSHRADIEDVREMRDQIKAEHAAAARSRRPWDE